MRMFEVVIFDFDGVLFESEPLHLEVRSLQSCVEILWNYCIGTLRITKKRVMIASKINPIKMIPML